MQLNRLFKLPFYVLSFLIISSLNIYAQEVVAEFGKYEITLDEFEHAYAKNSGGWEKAGPRPGQAMRLSGGQVRGQFLRLRQHRVLDQGSRATATGHFLRLGLRQPGRFRF